MGASGGYRGALKGAIDSLDDVLESAGRLTVLRKDRGWPAGTRQDALSAKWLSSPHMARREGPWTQKVKSTLTRARRTTSTLQTQPNLDPQSFLFGPVTILIA
jgi:hypothetical protein